MTGRTRSSTRCLTALTCAVLLFSTGCNRAPSFNILGSFFPAWILCGVIGIVLTVIVRVFFVRARLEQELRPLIVVYPCIALFFTFTTWLLFFS
jgi:YtcA family